MAKKYVPEVQELPEAEPIGEPLGESLGKPLVEPAGTGTTLSLRLSLRNAPTGPVTFGPSETITVDLPEYLVTRLRDMLTAGYHLDFPTVLRERVLLLLHREVNL
jgi:hypothetical protein